MIGIKCRLVHDSVTELPAKSGKSRSTGSVIVKIALDDSVVTERSNRLLNVGNGVEHDSVEPIVIAEAFR